MRINDWLKNQSLAHIERQATIEEAKAGKSLRRTAPHVRKAERLRKRAERLR